MLQQAALGHERPRRPSRMTAGRAEPAAEGLAAVTVAEAESFDAAYRPLFLAAMRLALRLTGDRAEAEDIAAEAMARAYVQWARLSKANYREPWLLRVTTNLALDSIRRRRPARSTLARVAGELRRHQQSSTPMDDDSSSRTTVWTAVAELPKRQREAVVLRYLVGVDDEEAAQVLGISASTTRTHVQRALTTLAARLNTFDQEDLIADER